MSYLCTRKTERTNAGAVVQLVRILACHARGRGFESRPHRQNKKRARTCRGSLLYERNGLKKSTDKHKALFTFSNGRLAQLVQSICLTSRGSAVRIRHRPQNLIGMAP